MGTAVFKSVILAVISLYHKHSLGEVLIFEAYGSVPSTELWCAGKIHDDLAIFERPAVFIGWLLGGTDSKYTLENVPV
jgi:hypothetical protein